MKWSSMDSLLVSGTDHQIKIFDIEKTTIQESIFTNHKTVTAMDCNPNFVIGGQEDGTVRVFDFRRPSGAKAHAVMQFESAHERLVSNVKINPQVDQVFLTSGYDGKIKMWDLRNSTEPLSVLKRNAPTEDKIFALAWNGASQILSGGADSHVSVHEM